MGLDMYLSAEKYIGGWGHSPEAEKNLFDLIVQGVGTKELVTSGSPSVQVRTTVAYWRKVNAVHSWFVRELANGVDECQDIYVSVEDMKRLIAACQAALDFYEEGNHEEAGKRMPPKEGFFFGDTGIDEWWVEGLKDTIKQLTPLVAPEVSGEFEFHYRASW